MIVIETLTETIYTKEDDPNRLLQKHPDARIIYEEGPEEESVPIILYEMPHLRERLAESYGRYPDPFRRPK